MRKSIIGFAFFAVLILTSCKGDTGQAGATGAAGAGGGSEYVTHFQYAKLPTTAYTAVFDGGMQSESVTNGYGTCQTLFVGYVPSLLSTRRAVIIFDIDGYFPATIKIKKAYLTLHVFATGTSSLAVRPIVGTWKKDIACGSSTSYLSWATNGYYSWGGGEYGGTIGTAPVTDAEIVSISLDTDTVKDWILHPTDNEGVIIMDTVESGATDHSVEFYSSDSIYDYMRPMLSIYYQLP